VATVIVAVVIAIAPVSLLAAIRRIAAACRIATRRLRHCELRKRNGNGAREGDRNSLHGFSWQFRKSAA